MAKQIYLLQHIHNQNWTYVGATKKKLSFLKAHKLSDARHGRKEGPIYQAMQQDHATSNWAIIRLHDFSDNWQALETAFIKLFDSYNNGLNATADGQRSRSLGIKAAAVANSKPVTNGTTCYASASEAGRATGIAQQHISACCLGKRKTAGNFKWEYAQ